MALGWGIFGLGRHVETRILPVLDQARTFRRVALCSRDRAKAERIAAANGFARAYDDYAAMLADPEVEAVYLVTPNALHRGHVELAARAGKHVLCEKPLALSLPDGEAMVAACARAGVRLGTAFHLRHHPIHQAARELVRSGAVGPIALGEARFPAHAPSRGGWWANPALVGANATLGLAVHAVDLLRFITGERVIEVTALTNGQRPDQPLEDMSLALLRFAGGGFAYVFGGRRVPRGLADVAVFGERARLVGVGTVGSQPHGHLEVTDEAGTRRIDGDGRDLYMRQFDAFAEAVAAGRDPDASGEDGVEAIRVAGAIIESAATGRSIVPPR